MAIFCRPAESEVNFDLGVAFDSWLYPIREEATALASNWTETHKKTPNLMFVNCENFQASTYKQFCVEIPSLKMLHPAHDIQWGSTNI